MYKTPSTERVLNLPAGYYGMAGDHWYGLRLALRQHDLAGEPLAG
jgi:hypothetical protein